MFTSIRDRLQRRTDSTQALADRAQQIVQNAEEPMNDWSHMRNATRTTVMPALESWQTMLNALPRPVNRIPLYDVILQFMQLSRHPMILETRQAIGKLEVRYRVLQMRRGTRSVLRWTARRLNSGLRWTVYRVGSGLSWMGYQIDSRLHALVRAVRKRIFR